MFVVYAEGGALIMYIYYPSCNFQRFFPETAHRIRTYLEKQTNVRIAGCCKMTQDLPKDEDTIITICLSCMHLLEEMRPNIRQISLFEFLLTQENFIWPNLQGRVFTLQDCFRARGKHGLQDGVRTCLIRSGAKIIEMPGNRDEETYCGTFMLHDPFPQTLKYAPKYFGGYLPEHLTILPREEWPAYMHTHIAQYPTREIVGYCNTCVRDAREAGADIHHLAELLFPE